MDIDVIEANLLAALNQACHDNDGHVDPNDMMSYVGDNDAIMYYLKQYNHVVNGDMNTPGWKAFANWLGQTNFPLDRSMSCY